MKSTVHEPVTTFNASLQAALDTESAYRLLPAGTWLEGGCALLAVALQKWVGGRLVTVGRETCEGVVDHVVLQVDLQGGPCFMDYDGVQTRQALEDKVCKEWRFEAVSWGDFDAAMLEQAGVPVSALQSQALSAELLGSGIFNLWKESPVLACKSERIDQKRKLPTGGIIRGVSQYTQEFQNDCSHRA